MHNFIGKKILIMTCGFFYTGILKSLSGGFAELEDPHIVYETGEWSSQGYKDARKMHQKTWLVNISLIESAGLSK